MEPSGTLLRSMKKGGIRLLETVILALFCALGIVLVFWCALGAAVLPYRGNGYCVLFADDHCSSIRQVRAYAYLLHSGLLDVPLCIVDFGLPPEERSRLERSDHLKLRVLSPQQWADFIETENWNRVSGT